MRPFINFDGLNGRLNDPVRRRGVSVGRHAEQQAHACAVLRLSAVALRSFLSAHAPTNGMVVDWRHRSVMQQRR